MSSSSTAGNWPVVETRRDFLRLAALGGIAIAGGGLAVVSMRREAEVAAKVVSPGFAARLCDIVLPPTGTPGAAQAGVPAFLPEAFRHGLFGGDALTLGRFETILDTKAGSSVFMRCSSAKQVEVLTALDEATFARRAPPPPATSAANAQNSQPGHEPAPAEPLENRLWRTIKDAIVSSYYTTEAGGSQELTFQLIAGDEYRADVQLGTVPYLSNYWMENVF